MSEEKLHGWAFRYALCTSVGGIINSFYSLVPRNLWPLSVWVLLGRRKSHILNRVLQRDKYLVHTRSAFGTTPLIEAVHMGWTKGVKVLMNNGADPEVSDSDGVTPISHAMASGRMDLVHIMTDTETDHILSDSSDDEDEDEGQEPVEEAELEDVDEEDVERLEEPKIVKRQKTEGGVGVHNFLTCIRKGDIRGFERYLERGVDVNGRKSTGSTPLRVASKNGRTEMLQVMKDHGLNLLTKGGRAQNSASTVAYENDQFETTAFLLKEGVDFVPPKPQVLITACRKGDVKRVDQCLYMGTDPNEKFTGTIPVRIAALHGHAKVLKVLLEYGALDIGDNKNDMNGLTRARVDVSNICDGLWVCLFR